MNSTGDEQAALADVAHILRRTGFGPFPGQVRRLLDKHGSPDAVLEAVIAADPIPFDSPPGIDDALDPEDPALGGMALENYWLQRMTNDDALLHEKMMWFWHAHFTSNVSKSASNYCWRQLRTFHRYALGSFGDLTKAMCVDAAMLQWLDAGGSSADDPNENLARELLELFTMGTGDYSEDDVRAAARGLAGWSVLPEDPYPTFSPSEGLREPVTFLGRTEILTPDLIVDIILDQEGTAPFIVSKLAHYFVGIDPDSDDLAEWSAVFRRSGYELRPVVEAILRSTAFRGATLARSRHGIEWLSALVRCSGRDVERGWKVEEFAQLPFTPPNVAGWPDRWSSTSSLYARAAFIQGLDIENGRLGDVDDPVDATLEHCGLFDVSEQTRSVIRSVAEEFDGDEIRILRATLLSPEFTLA